MRKLTTSYFERKDTKFVSNKTALLYVFSLPNSLLLVSFLRLTDLSHRQEQAGSKRSTSGSAKPGPQQRRQRRQ